MKLTKEKFADLFAEVVCADKQLVNAIQALNEYGVRLCKNPICGNEVHVFTGIGKLAEIFGKELKVKGRADCEYRYEASINVGAFKFFQIEKECDAW